MAKSTPTWMPDELEISIGGYFGPSYSVAKVGDELTYTSKASGDDSLREEPLLPTTGEWQTFWTALDKVDVWKWRSSYDTPGVMDGTGWSVKIARGDRTIAMGIREVAVAMSARPTQPSDSTHSCERCGAW